MIQERGAFWVHIESLEESWSIKTPSPRSCPQEAFMLAELEVLKAKISRESNPICVMALKKDVEIILAANLPARKLFGINPKGDIAEKYISPSGLSEYKQFVYNVRQQKKATQLLRCLHADGKELKIVAQGEIIDSPVSLYRILRSRIIDVF
ncbi:MAG: hypothetical protein AB1861_19790 [Cyanobacteriota bacterium]